MTANSEPSLAKNIPPALRCLVCDQPLAREKAMQSMCCEGCGQKYRWVGGGYWDFLPTEREAYFAGFLKDYETIRSLEGRDDFAPDQVHCLPFAGYAPERADEWRIRAKSYQALISALELDSPPERRILDLGCGNGWLSARLSGLGHSVCAVDIHVAEGDGLGSIGNLGSHITPIRAEFDRLPLRPNSIDIVIFNGSIHYTENLEISLRQAFGVLAGDGTVIIMDSPLYSSDSAGDAMVKDLRDTFRRSYGISMSTRSHIHYLTWQRIEEIGRSLGLQWRIIRPWYGLGWAMRPIFAKLRRSRQPAEFALCLAKKI